MYAYRVKRDCFKHAMLCYTVGRWKFEYSTRHYMEFKITKDKIVWWNKMLLFLNTFSGWQRWLTRWVHSQKFLLKYNPLPRLCTRLVSRLCHTGAVANVDLSYAVVCWMATRCIGKLKAPVVKEKSFELEWKAWRFFQADQQRGPMDYLSLHWGEKLSSRSKFRRENGLTVQVFQNSSVQFWIRL